jgi:23S rRNA (uridine2552-2'-O)-methyltransferase
VTKYKPRDRYYQKAKDEEFVARSVYKLEEIDHRYGLLAAGHRVVDLGAAPGSWLQYLAEKVGAKGAVVAYDLVPVRTGAANAESFVADVAELTPERIRSDLAALVARIEGRQPEAAVPATFRIDALVSDMAPKLTGVRDADQARSVALVETALHLASEVVKVGGVFVAKLFQGRDTDAMVKSVKSSFKDVKLLKPDATREGSREVFVIARERRPRSPPGPDPMK